MADDYLARFVLSHDMIRVKLADASLAPYVLAYINTPTGQALLRRDKTGSVIDHIAPLHVAPLEVPLLNDPLRMSVGTAMDRALTLREQARAEIDGVLREYEDGLPAPSRLQPLRNGWTQMRSSILGRLDAARYDPHVETVRNALVAAGGVECGSVAQPHLPGRYVRYYVGKEFGKPILSGRQLLQVTPINLQFISERSFREPSRYALRENWIALQAEGRAEERIAFPVIVTPDRDGWLANNHIMRLTPGPGVEPGALFLAMASWQVQLQAKVLATGSVVDALNTGDLRRVVLPALNPELGARATSAWRLFAQAQAWEDQAIADLEATLATIAGEEQLTA